MKDAIRSALRFHPLYILHSSCLSLCHRLVVAIKLIVTYLHLTTDDLKQYAVVIPAVFWVELLKHLKSALRGFLFRQRKRIFVQMVSLEVLY